MPRELKLWPILYLDLRYWRKPGRTNHHKPEAPWRDARPDFNRFDISLVRTEAALRVGEPKRRMPWRVWVYRKDAAGVVWGWHVDWMWFPPRRWCLRPTGNGGAA